MKARLTVLPLALALLLPQGGGAQWARNAVSIPPSTLLTGIVSSWPVNEESGTRYDVVGANHLTDNNTVGYAAGKNGNAASFVAANSEYLSLNAGLNSTIKTVSLWVYANNITDTQFPLTFASSAGTLAFHLQNYSSAFHFYVEGLDQPIVVSAITAGAWYHITAELNQTAKTLKMWRNGVQVGGTVTYTTGTPAIATKMAIGAKYDGSQAFWGGLIDEPIVWSRGLTDAERTCLQTAFWPYSGVCLP
jgi:hypothetical protein